MLFGMNQNKLLFPVSEKIMNSEWKMIGRRGKILHTVEESREEGFPGLRLVLASVKLCLTSDISAQDQLAA